ncbi:MAG: hypothetical protein ABI855_03500 [Bacteroidota bacterium]
MELRIDDSIDNYLCFDLRDILEIISEGDKYIWSIAMANFSPINDGLKNEDWTFIEKINDSIDSYLISWTDLNYLANLNIQTIDGIIKGKTIDDTIEINAFDSTYWTITTENNNYIESIKKRFKSIRINK